jgi:hypothetical protein
MSVQVGRSADVAGALTDLDAALPDIAGAFDSQTVGHMFARDWGTTITRCVLVGARYEPGVRCLTAYELRAIDSKGSQTQTFGAIDITPEGRALRRFDEDAALPGLATALDTHEMGRRLAALSPAPVESCTVTAIRYRPGERAVLRYGLTTKAGHVAVYGKVCAGTRERVTTLAALHEAAEADLVAPTVPAPMAVFDDLSMVVQPPAEGDVLHRRAFASPSYGTDRMALFRRTGRALAALHDGNGPPAPPRTLNADVDEVRTCVAAVTQADPRLGARLAEVADLATAACALARESVIAPSHGSMRTDHVHASATRVTFIDLDGYCRADRARDIGNFLAYLRWKSLRQYRYRMPVAEGRWAFRSGYARAGHAPADEIIRTAEAISLLKIAGRRFRNLSVREWPRVPALIDAALELLPGTGA